MTSFDNYAEQLTQNAHNTWAFPVGRGIIRDAALCVLCRYRHNAHWTRHRNRLDRDFGRKAWGDEGYAREELVAELGSAFLCADLELTPEVRDDHASYIASWLDVLRNDKRAIVQAASYAQRAVDYLHGLQKPKAEAA
jgi:antirestriction protein ArdC